MSILRCPATIVRAEAIFTPPRYVTEETALIPEHVPYREVLVECELEKSHLGDHEAVLRNKPFVWRAK